MNVKWLIIIFLGLLLVQTGVFCPINFSDMIPNVICSKLGLFLIHILMYIPLGILFALTNLRLDVKISFGCLIPILDEGLQYFTMRRYDMTDIYADIFGYFIGMGVIFLIKKYNNGLRLN